MSKNVSDRHINLSVQNLLVLVICAVSSVAGESALAGSYWTRDVTDGGTMADYPGFSLVVLLTSSIGGHLSASCGYRYLDRIGPVRLHGKFDSDGHFWPVTRYEVAAGPNKWRTIAQSSKPPDPVAIEIDFSNSHVMLKIDMEPFRVMIGRYRWGRIVLENGESATISLDDLLPTGDRPEDTDYKASITDEDPDRFGSSFSLVAVICLSKHLTGDFTLVCPGKRCVAELAGRRDSKGDFLPVVTLQAGNSDDNWQTLRESRKLEDGTTLRISNENSAQAIRVDLEPYRSMIGRLKYGKIVFSNGDFSVFEVDSLKPPFTSPPPVPDP